MAAAWLDGSSERRRCKGRDQRAGPAMLGAANTAVRYARAERRSGAWRVVNRVWDR